MELWKSVVDFEGLYQVSSLGKVRRDPDACLLSRTHNNSHNLERKLCKNKLGYLYLDLCKDGKKYRKTVHQLVMAAFNPNFKYGMIVNHIDGDKTNNSITNLEITTTSANEVHKYAHALGKKAGKSKYWNVHTIHPKYKDTVYTGYVAKVKVNNKAIYLGQFKTEVEAAKAVDQYWDSIGDTQHLRNFPKS